MGCKDCGDKRSRYDSMAKIPANIDEIERHVPVQAAPGFTAGPGNPEIRMPQQGPDPFASFFAAKKLSYEELTEQRQFQQRMMEQQAEQVMLQMTDAMRQVHVDELISVVNCDKMSVPGMTPGQALFSLDETLSREDFAFIEDLYPGLKVAVKKRVQEIESRRLPARKKE